MNIGGTLRSEREKKNLTIKDVENEINIRSLYIQALEEENYQVIPGEVYLKGFMKNYGNFLGLDGQQLVHTYKQQKQGEMNPVPDHGDAHDHTKDELDKQRVPQEMKVGTKSVQSSGNGMPLTGQEGADRLEVRERRSRRTKRKKVNVKNMAILIAIIGLIIGGIIWSNQETTPVPPNQPNIVPAPQQQQAAPNAGQAVPQTVKIDAKYTQPCWTRVVADGKEIYEGTPGAGQRLTWEAKKKMTLTFGNAGAVEISYNNQPQAPVGKLGQVVEKVYQTSSQAE